MDWSLAHSLNLFLAHHDGIEDPVLAYVEAAEALFLGMLLVACVLARHDRGRGVRRTAVAAGLSAGLGLLVAKVITEFWDRARPFVAHPHAVHLFVPHAADASFPSDHVTAAAAIAVAILLRGRVLWGTVLVVATLVLMYGRVALGFHYPSDVLGGAAIGALVAAALWSPRIRGRVNDLSDFAGSLWDRALDAVLARLPLGSSRAA